MPNLTANFSYNKPLVNNATDADLWGGYLNNNWDAIDADLPRTTSAKSSSFSVSSTEFNYMYLVDASGGAVTATLPAASNVFAGFVVWFKITDATNALTVDGSGSETIDGAATYNLTVEDHVVGVVCDGTNWHLTGFDIATQSEAETGTEAKKLMTPLRTKQAIDANTPDISNTIAGSGVGAMVFAETTGGTYSRGSIIAGSSLKPSAATIADPSPPSLSGTWTCLGYAQGQGGSSRTLWVRTS